MIGSVPNVPFWQAALGRPGETVQGLEDIAQCLTLLAMTQKGSVVLDPDRGVDLMAYLDRPLPEAGRLLERDLLRTYLRYEPRIEPPIVQVRSVPGLPGHVIAVVTWRPRGDQEAVVQVLGLGAPLQSTQASGPAVGVPGGAAPLGADGTVPREYLPPMQAAAVTYDAVDGGTT